ncbi:MAG TPA: DUF6445 family protein [Allosphingosinicella sp.]|nr:DUF6445 family protein [Allosphingosinicella sp.]
MRPELLRVGAGAHPLVVVDDFGGDPAGVVEIAAALAPFPRSDTYYPGLRRLIGPEDEAADAYVVATLERAGPFIAGAFDADRFELIEASFSMVTDLPDRLAPAQRAPHFDSTDPEQLAILHYLGGTERTGTAFYRQRSTGIETVDEANLDRFVAAAKAESAQLSGYTSGSNAFFDQIAAIDGVRDRLIIYRGSMLHSGIIPPDLPFDPDPRCGRLTANIFVRLKRG